MCVLCVCVRDGVCVCCVGFVCVVCVCVVCCVCVVHVFDCVRCVRACVSERVCKMLTSLTVFEEIMIDFKIGWGYIRIFGG